MAMCVRIREDGIDVGMCVTVEGRQGLKNSKKGEEAVTVEGRQG